MIEKGRILESGTHDELLAAGGHYHALYTRQFRQEREAGMFEMAGHVAGVTVDHPTS